MKRNQQDWEGKYCSQEFCAEEGYSEYGVTTADLTRISNPDALTKNITDMVIEDLRGREALGKAKYGKPLLPFDGRDTMRDLYEELLDAAHYIKKLMVERERGADDV
jgi:hypothetical protein